MEFVRGVYKQYLMWIMLKIEYGSQWRIVKGEWDVEEALMLHSNLPRCKPF